MTYPRGAVGGPLRRVRTQLCAWLLLVTWGCTDAPVRLPADDAATTDALTGDSPANEVADDTGSPAEDATATSCPGGAGCPCEDDGSCDDGDPCTVSQLCTGGKCTGGTPVCDDGNACTVDACDAAGTCTHTAGGVHCDDGDPCTIADVCAQGACAPGKPRVCDDQNACTDDVCQPGIGCVYFATDVTCVDETVCANAGYCHLGTCRDGQAKACDDGSPCTWDTCMPETGCTSFAADLSAPCTDTVHAGRCWTAVAATTTWQVARAACHGWGGELATVRSLPENAFVVQLASQACGASGTWLGLSDHGQEGHWRWLDGVRGGFNNWAGGEPNNAGAGQASDGEDFGVLGADGFWNDVDGTATQGCFVCARPLANGCDDPLGCQTGALCTSGVCLPATTTRTCDDGNACTADACTPSQGCSHVALADTGPTGTPVGCGTGGACQAGVCVLPPPESATPTSCSALLAASDTTPTDGVYTIDPDGDGPVAPFPVWCDHHSDGGGWTLAMKVSGDSSTGGYDSDIWLKAATQGTGLWDLQPGVVPSAWSLPVSAVRVGMREDGVWRWLTLPVQASSLQALFLANQPILTTAGMPAWQGLLASGSLQAHCQLEGFNVVSAGTALRIGIHGNNENDCNTVDSWIGIGAKSSACGLSKPVVGNVGCYGADNGDRSTATFAAILLR